VPENLIKPSYDVAVIGGGINGAVSAAALAARGLRVLLIDREDYAAVTSSQSSNLIWGGIKYLQTYEFWLVFKLCLARAKLMAKYPTRINSVGFFAALGPNAPFGKFLGTFGTLFYWFIGLLTTPAPKTYSLKKALQVVPNLGTRAVRGAVEYFDGMMPDNDSRFVWDFVSKSHELGATTANYRELVGVSKTKSGFDLEIKDSQLGTMSFTNVKVLVNAAGPFAKNINDKIGVETKKGLVFSKGIHLVVPRIGSDRRILAFWDEQGRLFYVIPMHDRSVIGTTDTRVQDPSEKVNDQDRQFVLRQINASMNLETPLRSEDIISERCGVRALVVDRGSAGEGEDWHRLSRKHSIEVDPDGIISILGGKFTDCLHVGQEVVRAVSRYIKVPRKELTWIGEDSPDMRNLLVDFAADQGLERELSTEVLEQLWRRHGKAAFEIVRRISQSNQDAQLVFEGLAITFGELRYIAEKEQVRTAEDLLRRRLPIAMVRTKQEIEQNSKLQSFLGEVGLL